MAKEKASFKEFLSAVAPEYQAFVEKLNNELIELGCDLVMKEVKSGYVASYQLEKKTVMNWVFRKSGVLARIYGDNARACLIIHYHDMPPHFTVYLLPDPVNVAHYAS